MTIERFILIGVTLFSAATFLYVPKKDFRKAVLSYLLYQSITWIFVIIAVEKGIFEYPVREFVKATRANFFPQFIIYPSIFVWYIILFPANRNVILKAAHYLFFISIPIWFIIFITIFTDLENFTKNTVYSQMIQMYFSFGIEFVACHLYIWWFFREKMV
jgi:hypothetical protein